MREEAEVHAVQLEAMLAVKKALAAEVLFVQYFQHRRCL